MDRFKSQSQTVEAARFTEAMAKELVPCPIPLRWGFVGKKRPRRIAYVKTGDGLVAVPLGGWLVRHEDGELSIMTDSLFTRLFEAVTDGS